MVSTKYSISAINRITGKSRTTILSHLKSGKLSYEEDAQGNKIVDASELMRVYGDECDFERAEGKPKPIAKVPEMLSSADQSVQQLLNSVQLQLDLLTKEREREREQLQQQIEHLQGALKLAQEGHSKAMLLLEHKPGGGDWEQAIKALEERIANREAAATKTLADLKETAKQEALKALHDKPWWEIMFGKQYR